MIVVKLGGSLASSGSLRRWLAAIEPAAGHVVIVPGGGLFADAVRAAQPSLGYQDDAAHEMALLAMAQYGIALISLCGALAPASSFPEVSDALARRRVPVWNPWPTVRCEPAIPRTWNVTSDSLALWMARGIGAPRVLLAKSRPAPPGWTVADLAALGLVDAAFPDFLGMARCEVYVAGPDEVPGTIDPALPPGRRVLQARAG
jgi:aspartokinase-like uncharacterized kinase